MSPNTPSQSGRCDCDQCRRCLALLLSMPRPQIRPSRARTEDPGVYYAHLRAEYTRLRAQFITFLELIGSLHQPPLLRVHPPQPPSPPVNQLIFRPWEKSVDELNLMDYVGRSFLHPLRYSGRRIGFAVISVECRSNKRFLRVTIRLAGQPVMVGEFSTIGEVRAYKESVLRAFRRRAADAASNVNARER